MKRTSFVMLCLMALFPGYRSLAADLSYTDEKEGVTYYFNYVNKGTGLELASLKRETTVVPNLNIPDSVEFMGIRRPVISIRHNALECGQYAYYTHISRLFIPRTVTSIGESSWPFYIENGIVVDEDNPVFDSRKDCNAIIETATDKLIMGCDATVVPEGIKSIGKRAFHNQGSSKTSLVVPESVEEVDTFAFSYSYFKDITFYGCVNIHERAFDYSSLNSIAFKKGVKNIESYAFYQNYNLETVEISSGPETNVEIGSYAFYDCRYMQSISIPEGINSIGSSAFSFCAKLSSVVFPNSLDSIGDYAFRSCYALISVEFGDNITRIGENAFEHCTGLSFLKLGNGNMSIGRYAFSKCYSLRSLYIPDYVKSIDYGAFMDCNLKELTLGRNSSVFGARVFDGNDILTIHSFMDSPPGISGPETESYVFNKNTFYNTTLYVPKGKTDVYRNTRGWMDFAFIKEMDDSTATGINQIVNSKSSNGKWYDLSGRRVEKAQKGIYIVNGKKVVK